MNLRGKAIQFWHAQPTFIKRQLAFTVVFAVTICGVPLTGLRISSPATLVAAAVSLIVTTVVAVALPWQTLSMQWRHVVPLASMVSVGLLRAATGEGSSPYGFLIILPALALGAEVRSRWALLLAALGCDLMVFIPYLVLENPEPASTELLLRALFIPFVATLAALGVYELARRVRERMATMVALQTEQEKLLRRTQHDAEELAETTRALRGARDAFGSVLDAVTEQSIIATDRDGLIRIFNPGAEKMLGALRADVVRHRHVTEFHLPAELDAVDERGLSGFPALVAEAAQGRPVVQDRTYVADDGREIIVALAVTPRYEPRGTVIGFLFVATDMTEAREVARLKDEFVSLISHELRTPLSSILGYLELVLDDEDNPLTEEQLHYLSTVERNANRLLRLVGDLLFTAQVEAGKFTFDEHEVDLVAVISASAESAMPAASSANITVESQLPRAPVLVGGDAVRLGQACDNLLSNAVKFTPRGGQVCISLEVRAGKDGSAPEAVVSVRDTSYGIAEAEVDSLFTRFFRASTATRHAISGVGLGLSITRAIVTAHHGDMEVCSVKGRGTTFSMRLPLRSL